jgi:hypothetical protein
MKAQSAFRGRKLVKALPFGMNYTPAFFFFCSRMYSEVRRATAATIVGRAVATKSRKGALHVTVCVWRTQLAIRCYSPPPPPSLPCSAALTPLRCFFCRCGFVSRTAEKVREGKKRRAAQGDTSRAKENAPPPPSSPPLICLLHVGRKTKKTVESSPRDNEYHLQLSLLLHVRPDLLTRVSEYVAV